MKVMAFHICIIQTLLTYGSRFVLFVTLFDPLVATRPIPFFYVEIEQRVHPIFADCVWAWKWINFGLSVSVLYGNIDYNTTVKGNKWLPTEFD